MPCLYTQAGTASPPGVHMLFSVASRCSSCLACTCTHRPAQHPPLVYICLGLARTIYIRCTYGIFGLEITKYTVYIYVCIRFWPTLHMLLSVASRCNNCLACTCTHRLAQHPPLVYICCFLLRHVVETVLLVHRPAQHPPLVYLLLLIATAALKVLLWASLWRAPCSRCVCVCVLCVVCACAAYVCLLSMLRVVCVCCMYVCLCELARLCMWVYMCIERGEGRCHTHTHTHTRTHTHIYTHMRQVTHITTG